MYNCTFYIHEKRNIVSRMQNCLSEIHHEFFQTKQCGAERSDQCENVDCCYLYCEEVLSDGVWILQKVSRILLKLTTRGSNQISTASLWLPSLYIRVGRFENLNGIISAADVHPKEHSQDFCIVAHLYCTEHCTSLILFNKFYKKKYFLR